MKCPYCGKEMDEGFMVSPQFDFCWTPKDKKPRTFVNHPREYEVMLKKRNFFKSTKLKVYRCSNCGKEIIDENDC